MSTSGIMWKNRNYTHQKPAFMILFWNNCSFDSKIDYFFGICKKISFNTHWVLGIFPAKYENFKNFSKLEFYQF